MDFDLGQYIAQLFQGLRGPAQSAGIRGSPATSGPTHNRRRTPVQPSGHQQCSAESEVNCRVEGCDHKRIYRDGTIYSSCRARICACGRDAEYRTCKQEWLCGECS